MVVGSKMWKGTAGADDDSNLTVGFGGTGGTGAWEAVGGGFGGTGLVSRPALFSDEYMTATLVDGEFIVPVSDQPMAIMGSAPAHDNAQVSLP